jgi:glycosyltransferase involved in cell wall biosynthesis
MVFEKTQKTSLGYSMKKKILVFCYSDLKRDPRVYRQITVLKDVYTVHTAGIKPSGVENKFFRISIPQNRLQDRLFVFINQMLFRNFAYKERKQVAKLAPVIDQLNGENYDLVLANEVRSLPFCCAINPDRIILDAHEFAIRQKDDILSWRLFQKPFLHYLLKKYVSNLLDFITVTKSIAEEYHFLYKRTVKIIENRPSFYNLKPIQVYSKSSKIRLIYHGGVSKSRRIDKMIEMMSYTDDRFVLDLMLVSTDNEYVTFLKGKIETMDNVNLLPPVEMQKLPEITNEYDIGLYILPPINFNSRYALPNKFFEYIQARLAVAIGPSPEMVRYVEKYDVGIVSPSFDPRDMARELNKLDKDQIMHYKNQCHRYARELSFDIEKEKLLSIVGDHM